MSIAEKLTTIAENEQRVFEAGKQTVLNRSNETEKTESGKVVSIYDGSPLHNVTVRLTSDTITDFSGIEVSLHQNYYNPDKYTFVNGSFVPADGTLVDSPNRIRLNTYIKLRKGEYRIFTPTENMRLVVYLYAENGDYLVDDTNAVWSTSNEMYFTVNQDGFINFAISYSNGAEIHPSDIQYILLTNTKEFPQTKLANADGTVAGFTPTECMTFVANNNAVDLAVKYYKCYGVQVETDAFWDNHQECGKRENYNYAFYGWKDFGYKPKYSIKSATLTNCFSQSGITDTKVDIVIRDVSQAAGITNVFYNATVLHTIRKLVVTKDTNYSLWFYNCNSLENIVFEGEIGNNIDVQYCKKLTHESLMSIINHLYNWSGSGKMKTLTLGTTNLAKLTDAEKVKATEKGWTLA